MDERKLQLKQLKKRSKREKRRRVTLWKTLGLILLTFGVLLSAASPFLFMFDNAVAACSGETLWEVINPDPNAVYFQQDFATEGERLAAGAQLRYLAETEGTVLLMNSGCLPLSAGAKVGIISASSEQREHLEKSGLNVVSGETQTDAVIVTLSGEDGLTEAEKADLASAAKLKKSGKAKAIVVLINTEKLHPVGFLQNNKYTVDACLWMGNAQTRAIADILTGKVNPSGILPDTLCYVHGAGEDPQLRYQNYVTGTGDSGNYVYKDTVAFPYGHGLSYTEFTYGGLKLEEEADRIQIQVGVTNAGAVSGKHTVQVYAQFPDGGGVQLVGFYKTGLVEPGSTEAVTVFVDKADLVEEGAYILTVAGDAHSAANKVLAAGGWNTANTDGRMDGEGDISLTCQWRRETALAGIDAPKTADDTTQMPITGAKNDRKLIELRGLPYDDLKWKQLLDQLTFEDMAEMIGDGFCFRMAAGSVHAPGIRDFQPGQSIPCGAKPQITEFPVQMLLAATGNAELLHRVGNLIGNDCLAAEQYCYYDPCAPSNRDSLLTSAACTVQAEAIREKGISVALWNQTRGLWVAEQGVTIVENTFRYTGNAAQGVLDGITVYTSVIPDAEKALLGYEQDPSVVWAMREACHRSLYVLVNSAAMNGIGPDSEIRERIPPVIMKLLAAAAGMWVLFIPVVILWIRGRRKWKKSRAYLNYRTLKKTIKAEKRAK